jgi:ABC-type Fe3+ transport system permease subunit
MDNIEFFGSVLLAGFCLLMYIAIFAVIAIVTTQAKQRSARRIMQAQARGAFADLETPKNRARFRILAGVALFGVLGFTCSIGVLALQSFTYYLNVRTEFSNLYWVTIGVGLIFGSIGAVAGFLMEREINRRL